MTIKNPRQNGEGFLGGVLLYFEGGNIRSQLFISNLGSKLLLYNNYLLSIISSSSSNI